MEGLHIIVFPGTGKQFADLLKVILKKSNYREIVLTDSQWQWVGSQIQKGKSLAEWKVFPVFLGTDQHIYLMPRHITGYIDNSFDFDVEELSKHTKDEIYYFWQEHSTVGYEKFQNGIKTKSIVEDTHGPRVEVDGQLVFESDGKLKIGSGLIDGKPIEVKEVKVDTKWGKGISYTYNYSYGYKNEPQFFPPDIFRNVDNIFAGSLRIKSERIIWVSEKVRPIEDLMKRKNPWWKFW